MTIEARTEHPDFYVGTGQPVNEFNVESVPQAVRFAGIEIQISDQGPNGGRILASMRNTINFVGNIRSITINEPTGDLFVDIEPGGKIIMTSAIREDSVEVNQATFKHNF